MPRCEMAETLITRPIMSRRVKSWIMVVRIEPNMMSMPPSIAMHGRASKREGERAKASNAKP